MLANDSDADGDALTASLVADVSHGTLSLGATSGLTFTAGDGTADAAMTLRGTPAAVNAWRSAGSPKA